MGEKGMDLRRDAMILLNRLGNSDMLGTAYDTAWGARLSHTLPSFSRALHWLSESQHSDGSWGSQVDYYHDRLISTLAAIVALAEQGERSETWQQVKKGERYIQQHTRFLPSDPCKTIGFELILPALLEDARRLDLQIPYQHFRRDYGLKAKTLQRIPHYMIYSRHSTTSFALEFLGDDIDLELARNLQETNGSIAVSPSATAYYLSKFPQNSRARQYLARVMDRNNGALTAACPFEVFERAWVLYNLGLAGILDELKQDAYCHLEYLLGVWQETGVSRSTCYPIADADDTAMVLKVLTRAGVSLDPSVFERYEDKAYFKCFLREASPSVSANVHVLDALRDHPGYVRRQESMIAKVLAFLREQATLQPFWFDKFHASPFYPTAHAVIAAIGLDAAFVKNAIDWIIKMQKGSGAWGYYGPTSEETAYCMQALIAYHQQVEPLDLSALDRAAEFLYRSYQSDDHEYPELWIGKSLYSPVNIVHSAVISALIMYEDLR